MDIRKLVSQMTLEEKAGLCSGSDFWRTKAVERLNIPKIMVSDGPNGLRKQDGDGVGINDSIKAVCFPTGSAVASSFDRDLIKRMGEAMGDECQAEDVCVLLGPAANIKRSPLCGRNFEYLSEDPYLATEMAGNQIKGVQSKNVGTSLKHFLANNQEYRRLTSSSEIDERTLREIYLAAFEGAVKDAKPWTIMCSYNRINGVYASEHRQFLTDILRKEWGFDGCVVSDWGAVNDRIMGLEAGLDLEMPSSGGVNDEKIVQAVINGTLKEEILDQAVTRILSFIFRYKENKKETKFDHEGHHKLARKVEEESMILLKNDQILPLKTEDKIAFIGKFAEKPRYQGGGSAHVNAFQVISALDAVKDKADVIYAKGYETKEDIVDNELIAQACEIAKSAKVAVLFVGLPDAFESEGYDRSHMSMPDCQNKLIEEVCAVQPNTVVVLHNGSPIEMPWVNKVKGILEVYLGGQAVGEATVNALFGISNPCGKLAETFPVKLADNPSYLYYLGEKDTVEYREGVFVGYRYYDKKKMDVLFPFGYGLSYTTFDYTNLKVSHTEIKDTDSITVTVDVKNTGNVPGKEIVQLYVAAQQSSVIRPIKELKGFEKIHLEPGETKTVSFQLSKRAFAYFNIQIHDWHVETGIYDILIGKSSRDIQCTSSIRVESTVSIPQKFTINSTIGDILSNEKAKKVMNPLLEESILHSDGQDDDDEKLGERTAERKEEMNRCLPLRNIVSMGNGKYRDEDINRLLDIINEE